MPFKDPQKKLEWELQQRPQRLAGRRELRQIEAAWKEAHPGAVRFRPQGTVAGFLLPLAAGGAVASYDPKLAIENKPTTSRLCDRRTRRFFVRAVFVFGLNVMPIDAGKKALGL
jgi:hypothetical protein